MTSPPAPDDGATACAWAIVHGVAFLLVEVNDADHTPVQELLRERGYEVAVAVCERTPIESIKRTAGALALHAATILSDSGASEDTLDAANEILADARDLLRFSLNFLDLRGDVRPSTVGAEPIDLANLIREILAAMEPRASSAGVRLHTSGDAPTVSIDGRLVRRVLANLVAAAIRRTPPRGSVEVRASPGRSGVLLRVIDTGEGTPAALTIGHDDGAQVAIGLAFCHVAAEVLGGRLWVERAGSSTAFCVELPVPGS